MGVVEKVKYTLEAKNDICDAICSKGCDVSSKELMEYGDEIRSLVNPETVSASGFGYVTKSKSDCYKQPYDIHNRTLNNTVFGIEYQFSTFALIEDEEESTDGGE